MVLRVAFVVQGALDPPTSDRASKKYQSLPSSFSARKESKYISSNSWGPAGAVVGMLVIGGVVLVGLVVGMFVIGGVYWGFEGFWGLRGSKGSKKSGLAGFGPGREQNISPVQRSPHPLTHVGPGTGPVSNTNVGPPVGRFVGFAPVGLIEHPAGRFCLFCNERSEAFPTTAKCRGSKACKLRALGLSQAKVCSPLQTMGGKSGHG